MYTKTTFLISFKACMADGVLICICVVEVCWLAAKITKSTVYDCHKGMETVLKHPSHSSLFSRRDEKQKLSSGPHVYV